MTISTPNSAPSLADIIDAIHQEFSNRYAFKPFSVGAQKSLLVRKSPLVGVQITRREQEIIVEGTYPSLKISLLLTLALILGLPASLRSPWSRLEREIALFLIEKYHGRPNS